MRVRYRRHRSLIPLHESERMLGWIFDHPHLGVGKLVAQVGPNIRIRYIETGQEFIVGPSALRDGSLARKRLVPQTQCTLNGEVCSIERVLPIGEAGNYIYEISFPDGRAAVISETELEPIPGQSEKALIEQRISCSFPNCSTMRRNIALLQMNGARRRLRSANVD